MLRVIIADDQITFRTGLRQILENIGDVKVVGEACNGKELLELADNTETDLIFMDIGMPVMNGVVTTTLLKKVRPDIRVICFSAYENEDCIRQMIDAGACGYLSKTRNNYELLSDIVNDPGKKLFFSEGLRYNFNQTISNLKKKIIMEPRKVVIVDDDIDVITVIETILRKEGFQVFSANDKVEGMKTIREVKPDLAILDVMMTTHYEGFELAKEITETPELKGMPVLMQTSIDVLVTTKPDVQAMAREFRKNPGFKELHVICIKDTVSQKAGVDYLSENGESIWFPVDGFIRKPVDAKRLLPEIQRILK
jgi:CheY-like chemotaxis protein